LLLKSRETTGLGYSLLDGVNLKASQIKAYKQLQATRKNSLFTAPTG
jgi:hypothetical protein